MPSAITHALVGACSGIALANRTAPRRVLVLSVVCAMLPDADVLSFALGIPHESLFGHRGFLHSLLFSAIAGFLLCLMFMRQEKVWSRQFWAYSACFSLLIALHGVLDSFTNGGKGVAFFSPFNNARLFFPFTPIEVSPANPVEFFQSGRAGTILGNEMYWIWMPALAGTLAIRSLLVACRRVAVLRQVACQDISSDRRIP